MGFDFYVFYFDIYILSFLFFSVIFAKRQKEGVDIKKRKYNRTFELLNAFSVFFLETLLNASN